MGFKYDIESAFTQCLTDEDAKKVFRNLSKKYHPDIKSGSADAFKYLNQYYNEKKWTEKKKTFYSPYTNNSNNNSYESNFETEPLNYRFDFEDITSYHFYLSKKNTKSRIFEMFIPRFIFKRIKDSYIEECLSYIRMYFDKKVLNTNIYDTTYTYRREKMVYDFNYVNIKDELINYDTLFFSFKLLFSINTNKVRISSYALHVIVEKCRKDISFDRLIQDAVNKANTHALNRKWYYRLFF